MKRATFLVFGLLVATAATPVLSQVPPEEQARRLLEDGRAARSQGKVKQALDSFGIVVTGFPKTSSVDDALLEIGRTHLELTGNYDEARKAFETVTTRYAQGDAAPGAYYFLGWLTLSRATTPAQLDDALAQFTRLQKVYSGSEWVPRALYATGLVHRRARRYEEAVDAQRRVFLEYPNNPVTPRALFECGHDLALLGRFREAMEEYQRIRNRFAEDDSAEQALERLTALYRLYGRGHPRFEPDASFVLEAGQVFKDVPALFIDAEQILWVASDKMDGAFPFDGQRLGAPITIEDPVGLAPLDGDAPLIAARKGLKWGRGVGRAYSIPGDKPGSIRELDHIAAALPLASGDLLISDVGLDGILRFDAKGQYQARYPDDAPREVIRMLHDGERGLVLLDARDSTVRTLDALGRTLRTVGPAGKGYAFRKPVDVAVDHVLNLYVADREEGLLLLSPQGELLARIGQDTLRRPTAVALAADGALFVYDDKLERVFKFR